MTTEEMNTQLYEKMFAEQEKYRQWLLTQPPDEILNHAYEYTIRNDILLSLEYNDLNGKQAQALLKSSCPLDDVFKAWEKQETGHIPNAKQKAMRDSECRKKACSSIQNKVQCLLVWSRVSKSNL